MKQTCCLLMSVLLVLPVLAGDRPAVPYRMGAVLEAESAQALSGDIDYVVQALGFEPCQRTVLAALAKMTGDRDMAGFDKGRPISLCFVAPYRGPGQGAPERLRPVALLPLARENAYLSALDKAFGKSEQVRSARLYSLPAAPSSPLGGASTNLYVRIAAGSAVIGDDVCAVDWMADRAAKGGELLPGMKDVPGTLRIGVEVQNCLPIVESWSSALPLLLSAASPGRQARPSIDPAPMLEAELDFALHVLKQVRTFSIGAAARPESVQLFSKVVFVPGSMLARNTASLKPVSRQYLSAFPPDAFLACAGSGMALMDDLIEPYCAMLRKIYGAMGPGMVAMGEEMANMMAGYKGGYAGDLAIGIVPGPDGKGIGMTQMVRMNDPAKIRKLFEDSIRTANEMGSKMPALTDVPRDPASDGAAPGPTAPSFSVKMGPVRKYKDVEIMSLSYDFSPPPAQNRNRAVAAQQNMVSNLLSGMKVQVAVAGNDVITCLGAPALIDAAIDRSRSGGGSRADRMPAFKAMFPGLETEPVGVFSLSLVRLLKGALAALPNSDAQVLAAMPEGSGGIAGYAIVKDGALLRCARIGMDEIVAVKASIPALQAAVLRMVFMGAMQGQGGTAADTARCAGNLRMIGAAKEQYALEAGLPEGAPVDEIMLMKFLIGGKMPVCPKGGQYTANPVGRDPACSVHGSLSQAVRQSAPRAPPSAVEPEAPDR